MGVLADNGAIVRSIYDAAVDDDSWANLPRLVAQHLEGESAVIWYAEGDAAPDFASFNQAPHMLSHYAEHYRFVDPWTEAIARHELYSTAFHGADLIPNQALFQTEFYHDFMRVGDILSNIGAHMCIGPGMISAIGIYRPVSASSFKDRHKRRLQSLIGHIEQMLFLRRQLRSQRETSELTASGLHSLSAGMVICDERARILFANAAAEALAAEHGGISLHSTGEAIAANRPEQTTQLRQMIAHAARGEAGGALCLHDEAGDRMLLVVSPLPTLMDDAPGRALIAMQSEACRLGPVAEMLIALFGLTAAEADLTWSLMQNQPLNSIRARRGVSDNTIRTQLAHVFAKTRTANQRELVRLLSIVPAVFEGEPRPDIEKPVSL